MSCLRSTIESEFDAMSRTRSVIRNAEECAALVIEQEPAANGATFTRAGSARIGDCYAEFGMTSSTMEEHMDEDMMLWCDSLTRPCVHLLLRSRSGFRT